MKKGFLFAALALIASLGTSGCLREILDVDTSDPGIKARLVHQLKADPDLHIAMLDIDVHSAIVTLSGILNSYDEKDAVVRAARRLRGVRQVLDNTIVQQ